MNASDWAAVYAAIVATGALALEIRRWFESGPKISVRANPDMTLIGQGGVEQTNLLVVNAVNRGDAPTTITHFCLLEYPNIWAKWRNKASQTFVVLHPQMPGHPPIIPTMLGSGQEWTGMAHPREDVTGDIRTGKMWAAIYTTSRGRPYTARVPKRTSQPNALKAAEKI
ncbi:hypothetical protein ACQZ48_09175 [Agrobacterium sp. 22-209-1]